MQRDLYLKYNFIIKNENKMIKVTIFNEFKHEQERENVKEIYPDGMHNTIKAFLENDNVSVRTVTE